MLFFSGAFQVETGIAVQIKKGHLVAYKTCLRFKNVQKEVKNSYYLIKVKYSHSF